MLSFSPEILWHDGVIFTSTNNIYSGVTRKVGAAGLEAAFSKSIIQWNGRMVTRPENLPINLTTCEQAEVLYPRELSTQFLRVIYVQNEEVADELAGQIGAVKHNDIEIKIDAELFSELG